MTRVTCGEARRLGWGRADRTVTALGRGLALAHVAQCDSCRRFAEDMQTFERQVQRAALLEPVPDGLTARLLERVPPLPPELRADVEGPSVGGPETRIEVLRVGRGRLWARRGAFGAALVAAAVAVLWLTPSQSTAPVEWVARMRDELLVAPGLESSDAQLVAGWLHARTGMSVHVPIFGDARLAGAAVVRWEGTSVAVLRYQVGSQYLGYAVLPRSPRVLQSRPVDGALHDATHRGLRLVSWSDALADHVWVGTLPTEALRSFATRCIEQAETSRQRAGRASPLRLFARSDV